MFKLQPLRWYNELVNIQGQSWNKMDRDVGSKRMARNVIGTTDIVEKCTDIVVFRTCEQERNQVVFQMGTSDAVRALKTAELVCKEVADFDNADFDNGLSLPPPPLHQDSLLSRLSRFTLFFPNLLNWNCKLFKKERDKSSMLTAFFKINKVDGVARKYLYKEFPTYFTWNPSKRCWNQRKKGAMRGRLVSTNPDEGERYYLRVLLSHVRGPTCFDDLYTVNNELYPTFHKAVVERGLVETDYNLSQCLTEASLFQFPVALRRLFATILIYWEPGDVRKLWDEHYNSLSKDYSRQCQSYERVKTMVLVDIGVFLQSMGKHLGEFDLPLLNTTINLESGGYREVQEEYSIVVEDEHVRAKDSLNSDQKVVYDEIMRHVDCNLSGVFFIDGPGGTGKTFLYKALLAEVRSRGLISLATASSGVAANNMPGGRTAHSRFKIPINLDNNSMCNIKQQSGVAQLLRLAKIIIWDESSMAHRQAIMIIGGDFTQVSPVVRRDTRAQIVDSSKSKDDLIDAIFPSLQINGGSSDYIISRAILSTKNENVDKINDQLIDRFIREQRVYYSFDEAEDDKNNFYPMEFLNSLNVSGLPPHYLQLKIGCPIILLWNIDSSNGLCNGTRLICKGFQMNVIDAEIAVGHHAGKRVFLPRIPLCPSADDMFPFKLKRKQFPIRLSFAMTVNKAQGQTIPNVGVYLTESVFSHGQLYVALSRGISRENTNVLVKSVKEFTNEGVYTSNVVYREILENNKYTKPATGVAAPVLEPAVKPYKLLHDILSPEVQNKLYSYFQVAAKKRSRRHLTDTDEYLAEGNLMIDPAKKRSRRHLTDTDDD
ncbi:hypothetical protein LXL04_028131 [Taraxacum kok-saghyz]